MLIEAMVAISVFLIGILGMFNLLNQSLGLNKIVSSRYIASDLAMEGVEVVKNIIDANVAQGKWNDDINNGCYEIAYNSQKLSSLPSKKITDCDLNASINDIKKGLTYLNFDKKTGIYSYSAGSPTIFKRVVKIKNLPENCSPGDCNEIKVNSIVTYSIKGGNYEIDVEDHFFNWKL